MRKQYHFRRTGRRRLAWDVDRLVSLTRELRVESGPLDQIGSLHASPRLMTSIGFPRATVPSSITLA